MNVLVVYASQYGNTRKVVEAIASGFVSPDKARLVETSKATTKDLEGIDLLIVGSPTQGGRPIPELQNFLNHIPKDILNGVKTASFDTRFLEKDLNFALRLLVKTIGYAAPKMAEILKTKGGEQIVSPEGFIVKGKQGPISEEELKRAKNWLRR